jgi:hypothetical protein
MCYLNTDLIPNNRATDISNSNCNMYVSASEDTLRQNAVQFTQTDIKYEYKVKRNEELCINHLVMNRWCSDLRLNTTANVKIILMSQIWYIQLTLPPNRDHTEWALENNQSVKLTCNFTRC